MTLKKCPSRYGHWPLALDLSTEATVGRRRRGDQTQHALDMQEVHAFSILPTQPISLWFLDTLGSHTARQLIILY
jgi:hypothetical protein